MVHAGRVLDSINWRACRGVKVMDEVEQMLEDARKALGAHSYEYRMPDFVRH